MLQIFPKATILALIAALALLLMLAVACASAATPTPVPTPKTGNWISSDRTDAISDSRVLKIALTAVESTSITHPTIEVKCVTGPGYSPRFMFHINWKEFLGSDIPKVAWRVNTASALTEEWRLDGDSLTAPIPQIEKLDKYLDSFIADLTVADKITARVYFYRGRFTDSITAVWHPAGFAEAYKPVAAACGK